MTKREALRLSSMALSRNLRCAIEPYTANFEFHLQGFYFQLLDRKGEIVKESCGYANMKLFLLEVK